jgi:hypothetical protein
MAVITEITTSPAIDSSEGNIRRCVHDLLTSPSKWRPSGNISEVTDGSRTFERTWVENGEACIARLSIAVQEDCVIVTQFEIEPTEEGPAAPSIRARFSQLVEQWRRQSAVMSSVTEMSMLKPYQEIIGMGEAALPLIFDEMKGEPDHWFWALQAITGEDPIATEHSGNVAAMTQDWLDWGREHGYA